MKQNLIIIIKNSSLELYLELTNESIVNLLEHCEISEKS